MYVGIKQRKQKPRNGKIKVTLWLEEKIHEQVKALSESEISAGRGMSIHEIYETATRFFLAGAVTRRR